MSSPWRHADTTDATAADTGSLQTKGGIYAAKDVYGDANIRAATAFKVGSNQVVGARKAKLTTQLSDLTMTDPVTITYALTDGACGAGSVDEFRTMRKAIANLQTRLGELEDRLQATGWHGLIADPT